MRYWYGASIAAFLDTDAAAVVGNLTTNGTFALLPTQRDAWLVQIELLREQLVGLTGSIFFEFNISRMGRRVDVALVIGPVVFALEFKVGEKSFDRSAVEQVWDYALDLKNFHGASHGIAIVPILIVTELDEAAPAADRTRRYLRRSATGMEPEADRELHAPQKKRAGFAHSEPEFLISYMDRHQDWTVIVCLVGGGQEINTGEAGIETWLAAVKKSFPDWQMYISERLTDREYAAGKTVELVRERPRTHFDDRPHLAVSMRSFRAENVSEFVKALLDCEKEQARHAFRQLAARYPMAITRDLNAAKQWIRSHARGTERYGVVASSKAMRLKPHAIDIRVSVDPVHYFLNGKDDTRSSYYLEDAATEFQVQGLELDWVCVT